MLLLLIFVIWACRCFWWREERGDQVNVTNWGSRVYNRGFDLSIRCCDG